jgi:hypothetical protein
VLEVLSPQDETFAKFDFYAACAVGEILVAHPTDRWVRCWVNRHGAFEEDDVSALLGVSMTELIAEIQWP